MTKPLPPGFEAIHLHEALLADELLLSFHAAVRRWPPVTLGLVLSNTLAHLGTGAVDVLLGEGGLVHVLVGDRSTEALIFGGGRVAELVAGGEWWRLLSCGWLHAGPIHLGLNMAALFGLGRLCEATWGPGRFLALYVASVLGGSVLSQLGGVPLSVGASGGVFGLLGAGVVFGLRHRRELPEPLRQVFGRGLAPWVVLNLFIGVVVPGIDNLGHVGGLVAGSLAALALASRVVPWERRWSWVGPALAAVSAAAIGWMVVGWWRSWGVGG